MSAVEKTTTRSFDTVKEVFTACLTTAEKDKMMFYNTWAEHYEQDVAALDNSVARRAANCVSSHFTGDRGNAVVLDVACGTGLAAEQLKEHGFKHFTGIDGSKGMLEMARKKDLYQDLKECLLGNVPLPVPKESFDVVVIVGALFVGHVPAHVVRELCDACKPGGYVCMTCGHDYNNLGYKADLERELKEIEENGRWSCVEVTETNKWSILASGAGDTYTSGSVYLYQKN